MTAPDPTWPAPDSHGHLYPPTTGRDSEWPMHPDDARALRAEDYRHATTGMPELNMPQSAYNRMAAQLETRAAYRAARIRARRVRIIAGIVWALILLAGIVGVVGIALTRPMGAAG